MYTQCMEEAVRNSSTVVKPEFRTNRRQTRMNTRNNKKVKIVSSFGKGSKDE